MKLPPKVLAGVMAFVLIAGSLAVLVLAPLGDLATAQTSVETTGITVPVGRLGDLVEYSFASNKSYVADGGQKSHWSDKGKWAFKVNGTKPAPDRTGAPHLALDLIFAEFAYGKASSEPGLRVQANAAVDLDPRDVLPQQYLNDWSKVNDLLQSQLEGTPAAEYVPRDLPHDSFFDFTNYEDCTGFTYGALESPGWGLVYPHWALGYQGRSYQVGQDLGSESEAGVRKCWTSDRAKIVLAGSRLTLNSTIAEVGVSNGTPLLRHQFDVDLRHLHTDLAKNDLRPSHQWLRYSAWLSPNAAYPVHVEYGFQKETFARLDGVRATNVLFTETTRMVLDRVHAGSRPIPWGECPADEHYRPTNPLLERTGGHQTYPGDGADSPLYHKLADAVRAVEADSTLAGFHAWRRAHPDHALVGGGYWQPGLYATGRFVGEGAYWGLAYSTPDLEVYRVNSSKDPNGVVTNEEWGKPPFPVPANWRFTASNLKPNLVTLSAMVRQSEAAVPETTPGVNGLALGWGYFLLLRDSIRTIRYEGGPEYWMNWGLVAHIPISGWGVLAVSPLAFPGTRDGTGMPYSDVSSKIDSGSLWGVMIAGAGDVQEEYLTVSNITSRFSPPQESAAALGSAPASRVGPALLVSTFFLAGLVAAYLYPLAKFYAGQALALLPGYAKIRRANLLNHKSREELAELIRSDPGVSPPELARRTGMAWTTLVYHLSVLEKNKLVSSLRDGRHKRFFPVDNIDWSRRGQIAAVRNERTRRVYHMIRDEPGIIRNEIAKRIGFSSNAAGWHLERLQSAGLVAAQREGRAIRLFPIESTSGPSGTIEVS